MKSYLSALAVLVLVATTPLPVLLRGLELMRAAALPADGGAVSVPLPVRDFRRGAAHAQSGGLARAPSRGSHRGGARFRAAAGALAVLFARSYARAGTSTAPCWRAASRATSAPWRRSASGRRTRFSWRWPRWRPWPCARCRGEDGVMAPLIEVRGLRFRYDDGTAALNGVDFRLDAGETVALLGANGSGKTTFVLHLNGLLAGEGTVEVCGLAVNKHNLPLIRRKIGLVFQDSESQLFMPTVLEDVAFGPLNRGLSRAEAAERAMAALAHRGYGRGRRAGAYHLSAGEKKRVAIAGILAMDPEILVLDEPTTFLDPPGQRALAELLARPASGQDRGDAQHTLSHRPCAAARSSFRRAQLRRKGRWTDLVARFGWDFALSAR